jgi:hypothetical protein
MGEKADHLRALLLKSLAMQAKQKCTNCCQICTPLLCIIFTYLIQVIAGDSIPVGQITTASVPVLANYPSYIRDNYSAGMIKAPSKVCWYLAKYDRN